MVPLIILKKKKSHALGALIQKIHHAKNNNLDEIEVWGSGKPIREWLYVEDGATALIKSLELEIGHFFFNIGVNKGMSIIDLAKKLQNILSGMENLYLMRKCQMVQRKKESSVLLWKMSSIGHPK